jgi:branched-chain amino acid transport system substrate-binding protein
MVTLSRIACSAALASWLAAAPAFAAEPYDIHAILPLTGGASFLGLAAQQTMTIAEGEFNAEGGIQGRPVRFIFHDDQSTPQIAVQIANEVLPSRPAVIIGSLISAICNAMAPLMQGGPVMYCLSPGIHPAAGSQIFSASVSSADYLEALLRYFRLNGWTRLAVVTTIDSSGQDADRGIDTILAMPENKPFTVVERTHYNPTDVNAAAQIERVRKGDPQVIIVWATGASIATIFRGLVQAGIDLPVAASTSTMVHAQMLQYTGFLPKQLYFGTPEWIANGDPRVATNPEVAARQKKYFQLMRGAGIQPDAATETVWDPLHIVIETLRKLGPATTGAQLREALATQQGFVGIDGVFDYVKTPQRGIDVQNTVVARWNTETKYWDVVSKTTGLPLDKSGDDRR